MIKRLIFDIDNTLKTYDEKVPSNVIKELFKSIKNNGFEKTNKIGFSI